MDVVQVSSSTVRAIGYDREKRLLRVEFHVTGVYHYYGVDQPFYEAFLAAPSKGVFANVILKNAPFPYSRGEAEHSSIEMFSVF